MPVIRFDTIDPWPDHPAREKIRFYVENIGIVTGLLPEQFGFTCTNTHTAVLGDILSRVNTMLVAGQQIVSSLRTGTPRAEISATIQELKQLTWTGGSPLTTSVTLLYIARTSANLDVVRPIKRLIEMSAGSVSKKIGVGSASATVVKPPPVVQVEFGNVIRLKTVHITYCNWKYSSVVDPFGVPTSGIITLNLTTDRVFISDDLDESFIENESSPLVREVTPGA